MNNTAIFLKVFKGILVYEKDLPQVKQDPICNSIDDQVALINSCPWGWL